MKKVARNLAVLAAGAFGGTVFNLPGAVAVGAELDYGIEAGIGQSDNIARTPGDEIDETIATVGADLSWQREGRLDADVQVDVSWYDYLDGTYESEILGGAAANLSFGIVPDRFEWVVEDTFGQMDRDPFAASTPENRENVNYFTTGPDLIMRLGSAAEATLFGRFSSTAYEETNLDGERLAGGLSVSRGTSARGAVSLNVVAERVEFDDTTVNSSYDRQSAFLRYEAEGARTRLDASAGYTVLHDFGEERGSPLFDLEIERDLSPSSRLVLIAGIRSSDASEALRGGEITGGSDSSPGTIATADPFEMREVSLDWTRDGRRTTLALRAGWREDVYEHSSDLDRTRTTWEATFERRLTEALRLRLIGSFNKNEYDNAGFDDEEFWLGLGLSWNVTGRLYVDVDADHYDRQSSESLSEYDENRVFLRFAWRIDDDR